MLQLTTTTRDVAELTAHLKKLDVCKHDIVCPPKKILFTDDRRVSLPLLSAALPPGVSASASMLRILDTAHTHLSAKLKIPKDYYDRMNEEHPALLAANLNGWMQKLTDNLLLRTYIDPDDDNTGYLRAALSDRFWMIDHYQVTLATLDAIKRAMVPVEIVRCALTEKTLDITFMCPQTQVAAMNLLREYRPPAGHGISHLFKQYDDGGIYAGFSLRNSEVGMSKFVIVPRVIVGACVNGMVQYEDVYEHVHLGKKSSLGYVDPSHRTLMLNSKATVSEISDHIAHFASKKYLNSVVDRLSNANRELEHPVDAVRNVAKLFSYSEAEEKAILDSFSRSRDTSKFGIMQAMTFAAQSRDADRGYEIEMDAMKMYQRVPVERIDKPYEEKRTRDLTLFQN